MLSQSNTFKKDTTKLPKYQKIVKKRSTLVAFPQTPLYDGTNHYKLIKKKIKNLAVIKK